MKKAVVAWDDTGSHKVTPYAHVGTGVWVRREEPFGVWVCVFEEFTDYRALVKGFGVVFQCWDKTAGIEFQERLRLVVGVYL